MCFRSESLAAEEIGQIDVKPFGAVANSVAVHDGVIAVAVENAVKTMPGHSGLFRSGA